MYRLLASHTKDPSSISKCRTEGSLASSKLQCSKDTTKEDIIAHEKHMVERGAERKRGKIGKNP
jgi:hypothetical protein